MSQSEFTARRPDDAAAANGCESFLCEQRIDNSWRILLTMGPDFYLNPLHLRPVSGCFPREAPEEGKKEHLPKG
jgi:hypothetical protein